MCFEQNQTAKNMRESNFIIPVFAMIEMSTSSFSECGFWWWIQAEQLTEQALVLHLQ